MMISNLHWIWYLLGLMIYPRLTAVVFVSLQTGVHIGFKITFAIAMIVTAFGMQLINEAIKIARYRLGQEDLIDSLKKQVGLKVELQEERNGTNKDFHLSN